MALFGETVPRAMYDDMKQARDTLQQECSTLRADLVALTKELVAVKRHELGLPPAGFEPKDPTAVLGPKTKAAIDQMSAGFGDVAGYLTNWAIGEANARKAHNQDAGQADEAIAHAIRMGDTE